MKPAFRKIIIVTLISALPLLITVYQNFFRYRRGWHIPEIQYHAIFWMVRWLLAPVLAWFTIKYGKELNKPVLIIRVQIMGFLLYLLASWSLSFVCCREFTIGFDGRNLNLFNIIKNESSLINLLVYIATIAVLYIWMYVEQSKDAEQKTRSLEQALNEMKCELSLKQVNNNPLDKTEKIDQLSIKTGYKTIVIPVSDIACLSADGPYVKVITGSTTHLLKRPLYELQTILPHTFLRVHRSHIVNIDFINEVRSLLNGDYTLLLKNGIGIRASRTYRENLKAALGNI